MRFHRIYNFIHEIKTKSYNVIDVKVFPLK